LQQNERFAVAATAFVLKHESRFRSHFLQAICNCGAREARAHFDIDVEPWWWCDLVLKNSRSAFVIEFKIKAKLADHQNPRKAAFFRNRQGTAEIWLWPTNPEGISIAQIKEFRSPSKSPNFRKS